MQAIESAQRARIAKLAYYFYLERVRQGLPGNEVQDWKRAERAAVEETPSSPTPASAASARGTSSQLPVTAIKGIGPKVASELARHGVTTVDQLASWTLADFGVKLPRLTARARNGDWIQQAGKLAKD